MSALHRTRNLTSISRDVGKRLRCYALGAAVLIVAGCAGAPTLAPTPTLYADTHDDPFESVPAELQTNTVSILYATDRQADTSSATYGYSSDRSQLLAYGVCEVTLGDATTSWQDLVDASRVSKRENSLNIGLTGIDERGYFPERGALIQIDGLWRDTEAYQEQVKDAEVEIQSILVDQLAKTDCKEVFIFVHGYNNTFGDAAIRVAEIWHFMGRGGVPVVFSWPAGSGGLLRGYTRDRESGEFSTAHLKQFIRTIVACPEVQKINLIAHSRGNDVLTTAIKELHIAEHAAGRNTRESLKLCQVLLVAPDIDLDVVVERFGSERLGMVPEQLTIYVSPDDMALGLSKWLFGSIRRLGQVGASDMTKSLASAIANHPVISIVDVKVKSDFLGHGYITASPEVLSDIILVLRDHKKPGEANGRPLGRKDGLWELHKGYPTKTASESPNP